VLEQGTVDLLNETGLGERMRREGLIHRGIALRFGGRSHRIDFVELTGGKEITVYGQHEVVKDLIAARLDAGGKIVFEAEQVSVHELEGSHPVVRYHDEAGMPHEILCDFIAGCDGSHGVCRTAIPEHLLMVYQREYPFGWLGVLANSVPVSDELIYTHHARGFALFSMRAPIITRLYLQCAPNEDITEWPDERIWQELHARLEDEKSGARLDEGPIMQKGITAMRSLVVEPMRHGRLFLAGDAAHIVPATGAKGLNLAVADASVLARAFAEHYASGRSDLLDRYSDTCLRRVWKVQRFSWWMTSMLHRFSEHSAYDQRIQLAELDYVTHSRAAAQSLAENYVGLPID
jgi:p-hydroxybenzoate 3-monooxygenase